MMMENIAKIDECKAIINICLRIFKFIETTVSSSAPFKRAISQDSFMLKLFRQPASAPTSPLSAA